MSRGEQLNDLMESLGLKWKTRRAKDLIIDFLPFLTRHAQVARNLGTDRLLKMTDSHEGAKPRREAEDRSAIVADCGDQLHVEAGPGVLESVDEVVLAMMLAEQRIVNGPHSFVTSRLRVSDGISSIHCWILSASAVNAHLRVVSARRTTNSRTTFPISKHE